MAQKEAELDEELETTGGDDDVIAEDADLNEVFKDVTLDESEDGANTEDPGSADEGGLETSEPTGAEGTGEGTSAAGDPNAGEPGQPRGKDGRFTKPDPAAVAAASAQPNQPADPNAPPATEDRAPFAFRFNKQDLPFEGAFRTKDGEIVFSAAAAPHLQNILSDGMAFRGTKAEREADARRHKTELEAKTREHADVVATANELLKELEAIPADNPQALADFHRDFIQQLPVLREKHRAEAATRELESMRASEKERNDAAAQEEYERETSESLVDHILELAESPEYKDLMTDEDWVEISTFLHEHKDRIFERVETSRLEGDVQLEPGEVAFKTDYVAQIIEGRAKILRRVKEQATAQAKNAEKVITAQANEKVQPKGKTPPPVVTKRESNPAEPRPKVDPNTMTKAELAVWQRKPLEEQMADLGIED